MLNRRILPRYIAAQTFFAILSTFVIYLVLIIFVDIVELLKRGQNNDQFGVLQAFFLASLRLPLLSEKVLPFAVLFGSMFAFFKLNRRQELIIARSTGLSIWQFLTPPIVIAVIIGVFSITVMNPVGAHLGKRFEEKKFILSKTQETSILKLSKAGLWLKQKGNKGSSILLAGRAELGGALLKNIIAWKYNEENTFVERIEAPIAELHEGYWSLTGAWVTKQGKNPVQHKIVRLETFLTSEQVSESFTNPDSVSFWQLPQFIEIAHKAGLPANRFQVHYHTLLSRPILLGAMVIIAAIFSMQVFRLGKIGRMIVGGISSGFFLYFLTNFAESLGSAGRVPPFVAAWSPASIALMIGVTVLLYSEDG